MTPDATVEHVTCLGCGCGCDDVTVTVRGNSIVDASPVCPLGRSWFGDGQVPGLVLSGGQPVDLEGALTKAATELLRARGRCLVYLAPDLSSEAYRAALEIADILKAAVDCDTSDTAANGLVTAQRRGRASATLGEIRNRGDVFLFWGIDPAQRYPRFLTRYSVEPPTEERGGREVIGVSVGADRALSGADLAVELEPETEITVLSLIRAAVSGREVPGPTPLAAIAKDIAGRLTRARYAVVVHDAEPTSEKRNPLRSEALVALTQVLNGPTRAALCTFRAGGNRVGAEAVLTSQTGYPFAVDYSRGYPRYRPELRSIGRLERGNFASVLVVGSPRFDVSTSSALSSASTTVIGPRASQTPFETSVAIDTGVAGIHDGGTAYRMDEVPLSLRPPLGGPNSAAAVIAALSRTIRAASGASFE